MRHSEDLVLPSSARNWEILQTFPLPLRANALVPPDLDRQCESIISNPLHPLVASLSSAYCEFSKIQKLIFQIKFSL